MPSFDIVSKTDLTEVDNAINGARREIDTRFDFKGSKCTIERKEESITLLANVSRLFADRCIDGIEADVERCRSYAEATPQAATALNPVLGYERVAALVKESAASGRSIREVVLDHGLLDEAELDRALDLLSLTRGGRPGAD